MAHESFISDSEIVKVELDNTKYNGDKYNILLSHRPELVVITLYNKKKTNYKKRSDLNGYVSKKKNQSRKEK